MALLNWLDMYKDDATLPADSMPRLSGLARAALCAHQPVYTYVTGGAPAPTAAGVLPAGTADPIAQDQFTAVIRHLMAQVKQRR